MRVFWLFNHPAPYKVEFFNRLGRLCELTVYFERATEKGRNAIFYSNKALSFNAKIGNPLPLGGYNSWSREPARFLAKHHQEFDVIVINGWRTFTEMNVISLCKKKGIPYVFYINGGIYKEKENPVFRYFKRRYLQGADHYLAPDNNSANYLTFYGVEESRITIYPYGSVSNDEVLRHPVSKGQKQKLRKELGLDGEKVFVSSGQFIDRKNFEQLIALWSKLPKSYSLYITGEGPKKKKYLSLIKELGLENIHLVPYLDRKGLFSYFQAADAFILLSKEDIFGHVVNESMSQGLPAIISDKVNAGKAFIQEGVNGHLVDLENEEGIINAILDIDSLSPEACLEVARKNTYDESASFHIGYFKSLLKEKGE